MYKDGKPDHEAPMHSRQKLELSAKAEAAIREEMQAQAATQPASAQATMLQGLPASTSANFSAPIQGL